MMDIIATYDLLFNTSLMVGEGLGCAICLVRKKHLIFHRGRYIIGGFIAPMALMAVAEEKHPSACIVCRSCEAVCPQQIKISEAMADFASKV